MRVRLPPSPLGFRHGDWDLGQDTPGGWARGEAVLNPFLRPLGAYAVPTSGRARSTFGRGGARGPEASCRAPP